jgi:hypothetical protein
MKKYMYFILQLIIGNILFANIIIDNPIFILNNNKKYEVSYNTATIYSNKNENIKLMVRYDYYLDINGESINFNIFLKPKKHINIEILKINNVNIKKYFTEWGSFISRDILVYSFELDNIIFYSCLIQFTNVIPSAIELSNDYLNKSEVLKVFDEIDNLIKAIIIKQSKAIIFKTNVNNLRLREKSSLSSNIIRLLSSGEEIELLEAGKKEEIDNLKGNWVKVKTKDDSIGCCFDGYLDIK